MGVLIQDSWFEILLIFSVVIAGLTNYFHNCYQYWTKKSVATITPRFPWGNANTFLPQGLVIGTLSKKFYDEFKQKGLKFGGVYILTRPNLVLVDPEYIKDVINKDFNSFGERGVYHNAKDDSLSVNLFTMDYQEWRNLRIKLTSTFTSGKIKIMFQSVVRCSDYMVQAMKTSLGEDLDIKEVASRFSIDVIGSCIFGIECNSFQSPDAEFPRMGKRIFDFDSWRSFKVIFSMTHPRLSRYLGVTVNNHDVQLFFRRIVKDTVTAREENGVTRADFLQILMNMRESTNLTLDEIAAQAFVFFTGGFESTSLTITSALYELAKNPEMQDKLRAEILDKCGGEEMTYESLSEMKYLAQVLEETLRKYPPVPTLTRRCTKDYTLRGTDVVAEKGTQVYVSILGMHRDPEYYPDPEKFDPERFNDDNKKSRLSFTYLPFGDGPRNCIGVRFGAMQTKIGIATIVKNFRVSVCPKTKPIEFNPYSFLLKTVNKVYLKAERVS
jgi:cytochrome P450 family 6